MPIPVQSKVCVGAVGTYYGGVCLYHVSDRPCLEGTKVVVADTLCSFFPSAISVPDFSPTAERNPNFFYRGLIGDDEGFWPLSSGAGCASVLRVTVEPAAPTVERSWAAASVANVPALRPTARTSRTKSEYYRT